MGRIAAIPTFQADWSACSTIAFHAEDNPVRKPSEIPGTFLYPDSIRFMVPLAKPRQGATVGYHAVLIRGETVRFSDAWFHLENWLGWQGLSRFL